MKRYTKIAMLALCLALGGNSIGATQAQSIACTKIGYPCNPPNGIAPKLAKAIIKAACQVAGMDHRVAWVYYVQGVNTIAKIPGFYRVTLVQSGGPFVIVDIIDDL